MFHVVESSSVMDDRKRFTCSKCGEKHIIFSHATRECPVCKKKFPNVFLVIKNKSYRINYYFLGAKEPDFSKTADVNEGFWDRI